MPASIRGSAVGYYGLSIVFASAAAPFLAILFIHIDFIALSFITPALLLFSALLTGLGYGSFFSGGQSYALLNAPKNKLGLATSTYYIFLDIGGGIGPYIFGFAGESLGYKAMYQICAGLVFIVLILYFFLIFKRKNC